jgi:ATP-dependent helicase/nuclease subunit A
MRGAGGDAVVQLDLETSARRSDELRREEGEAVARFIRDLVDSRREVLDPVTKEMRPVTYGDIALVYRSTTGIDRYEDPLREADIPYLVEGGKLYYTRQEVRDLASAVWVVEDPYDSVALLAVLRSPIFGFSDEEIFLFTRAGGRLCYLDPGKPGMGFEDFLASFELLSTLHGERNTAGPAATLGRLLARTGYLSSSKLRAHGEQRILNLRKAVQTARLFEEKGRSFRYYARWMRDQDTLGAAEGESPAVDEGENAVRMITIHKAKGLQFPVVILVNLVQAMHGAGRLIGRGGGMPALRIDGRSTGDYDAVRGMEDKMDTAETIRMLYVAATRAGDMLVIPAMPPGRRGRPPIYDFIASAVEDLPGVKVSGLPVLPPGSGPFPVMPRLTPSGIARGAEIREKWAAGRKILLESSPPGPVPVSPSGLEEFAGSRDVARRGAAGPGGAEGPGGAAGPGGTAAAGSAGAGAADVDKEAALDFGRAFHRMMELLLDPRRPAPPDEAALEAAAMEAAEEFGIGPREELFELGAKALGSDIVARAAAAENVLAEPPFMLSVDTETGESGTLSGRLDLVFESEGGWTVVDFKTDDVDAAGVEERLESYRPQGAAYAYALESLGVSPVIEVIFYFVRPGIAASAGGGRELAARGAELVGGAIAASTPSSP